MSDNQPNKANSNAGLSHYVSNTDKQVYTVSNLPEEVIATIFAYVSRSPKSFRENLLTVTEEKASQFHEKWVLNYGHASVAELATVHLGIEKVSRLFSAILERANLYISPIEYSQRYQKPLKGDFYIPTELSDSTLRQDYISFQNDQYDDYHKVFEKLLEYYLATEKPDESESDKAFRSKYEKLAFEDARYLLTLAVHTNLGLTANARAMEDCLIHLLSSEYTEVRDIAEQIKDEVTHSLPTLVKYAQSNSFLVDIRNQLTLESHIDEIAGSNYDSSKVKLLRVSPQSEELALDALLSDLLYAYDNRSYKAIELTIEARDLHSKRELFDRLFSQLGTHDNPPKSFNQISYQAEFILSESCWHQLLRHRRTDFTYQHPTIQLGYIVPPKVIEAGIQDFFVKAMERSQQFYNKLSKEISTNVAHYAVCNGHYRRVVANFSLWELYHLINLRMTAHAQWEIRYLIEDLVKQIQNHHPGLVEPALKRLKKKSNNN